MAFSVSAINGFQVYNLSTGKSLKEYLALKTNGRFKKSEAYRRRLELVQDLEFPVSSQRIKFSRDGNYLAATGMYAPVLRVYDLKELSMKFERGLDAEVTQFQILTDDYRKMALLRSDRVIEFHASYGHHHNLRIPYIGRDMDYYGAGTCLFVASSSPDIYRVDLEEGRFMAPYTTASPAVNAVHVNPENQLLGAACEDGFVEAWDPRTHKAAARLQLPGDSDFEASAIQFDRTGVDMAVGTSDGRIVLYDIRSSRPLLVKDHQYEEPIKAVRFHHADKDTVMSLDSKIVKIWDKNNGNVLANLEPGVDMHDLAVAPGPETEAAADSGVVFIAAEQQRVLTYYMPNLGIAPQWASFLDNITEELEEEAGGSVYSDLKFVTKDELNTLGISHLIGTPLLKAHMHGYFMDMRLYQRLKVVADPFAFKKWRQQRIREKLESKRSERIVKKRALPEVNKELAKKLLDEKKTEQKTDALLTDDRFGAMFSDPAFQIDTESREYRRMASSGASKMAEESDSDKSDGESDSGIEEEQLVGTIFERSVADSSAKRQRIDAKQSGKKQRQLESKVKMYEAIEDAEEEKLPSLLAAITGRASAHAAAEKEVHEAPLAERLRQKEEEEPKEKRFSRIRRTGNAMEITLQATKDDFGARQRTEVVEGTDGKRVVPRLVEGDERGIEYTEEGFEMERGAKRRAGGKGGKKNKGKGRKGRR